MAGSAADEDGARGVPYGGLARRAGVAGGASGDHVDHGRLHQEVARAEEDELHWEEVELAGLDRPN